jgi:hypothetical protein
MSADTLSQSRLVTLKSGQIVGSPITRRQLKRDLRQLRLHRRAGMRMLKAAGFIYAEISQKALSSRAQRS